ncbi:MAG: hypothetical protein FWG90_00385 [Oscillospiraceae bacterium]|nr:hypothetical protein [Oscillospiraceae bacterium]
MIKIWAVLIIAVWVSFSAAGCSFEGGSVEMGAVETLTQTDQSADETEEIIAAEKTENQSGFVYPDEPLTKEGLALLVNEARTIIFEDGVLINEMKKVAESALPPLLNFQAPYVFGLVDIDFDGMPELFCLNNHSNQGYKPFFIFSLNQSNFAELLIVFKGFHRDGETYFAVNEENKMKKLIVVSTFNEHRSPGIAANEIIERNSEFSINEVLDFNEQELIKLPFILEDNYYYVHIDGDELISKNGNNYWELPPLYDMCENYLFATKK